MRKIDKLAKEKFGGDIHEALKYTMMYYSKAEINRHWGEWSEEEQKYAAKMERENPNRRYIREFLFRMLYLLCIPLGIGALALIGMMYYGYGTLLGILTALLEAAVIIFIFRKKIKYTDILMIIIVVVLGIAALVTLVLSEALKDSIFSGIEYLKSL